MKPLFQVKKMGLLVVLVIISLSSACTQSSGNNPGAAVNQWVSSTPAEVTSSLPGSATPTRTQTASPTPRPTITPRPTRTRFPTRTPLPPTATEFPWPELSAYLPLPGDAPQCSRMSYQVNLSSASMSCSLWAGGSSSISIEVSGRAYDDRALQLSSSLAPIDLPLVGQGSAAGVSPNGNSITALFYKHTAKVTVVYNSNKQAQINNVLPFLTWMDKKVPDELKAPRTYRFPDTENLALSSQYFSGVRFEVLNQGISSDAAEFPQGSSICLYVAPKTGDYQQLWSVVLYDVKKDQVLKKYMYEMYTQKLCGNLDPSYSAGQFVAGDSYQIRIAVGEDWVVTIPFTTK